MWSQVVLMLLVMWPRVSLLIGPHYSQECMLLGDTTWSSHISLMLLHQLECWPNMYTPWTLSIGWTSGVSSGHVELQVEMVCWQQVCQLFSWEWRHVLMLQQTKTSHQPPHQFRLMACSWTWRSDWQQDMMHWCWECAVTVRWRTVFLNPPRWRWNGGWHNSLTLWGCVSE